MNKIVKIIALLIAFSISSIAGEYSSSLDEARALVMSNYKAKEGAIFTRVENRIMTTSKFDLLRKDVQDGWGLPYTYWNNFEKEECANSADRCTGNTGLGINLTVNLASKQIMLTNSLGSSANTENISLYQETRQDEVLIDSTNRAIKPFSIELSRMYDLYLVIIANPSNVVSVAEPADTTKQWYKPNGYGGYDIFSYKDGAWGKIGTTSSGGSDSIHTDTEAELFNTSCSVNALGYVGDGVTAIEYICNNNGEWEQLSSGSIGLFNGDASIPDLAKRLINKSGGSVATSSAVNGEFGGAKEFTKKDNTSTGGYWVDAANSFIISETLAGLKTQAWALNTYGYFSKTNEAVFVLKRMNVGGVRWVYQANGYGEVATLFDDIDISDGGYVYDTSSGKFFKKFGNVWRSNDGTIQLSNHALGRSSFSSFSATTQYLINSNDCTSTTCNGNAAQSFYAGVTNDGMYSFYYANAGKRKNNLIDAIPRSSIAEIYINGDIASLYNGAIYLKDADTLGRVCYKNSFGAYFTKSGKQIPPKFMVGGIPELPISQSCTDATWSGNSLILDNRTQATDWVSAPHLVTARIGGFLYAHLIGSGKDFWTNNSTGDAQQNASEVFTRGSRSMLPVISHSIEAMTKNVGTEPRYTASGVVATLDNSFQRWFYSVTGTITQNLLDGRIASEYYSDINAGSYIVYPSDGRRIDNGQVWETFISGGYYGNYKSVNTGITDADIPFYVTQCDIPPAIIWIGNTCRYQAGLGSPYITREWINTYTIGWH